MSLAKVARSFENSFFVDRILKISNAKNENIDHSDFLITLLFLKLRERKIKRTASTFVTTDLTRMLIKRCINDVISFY